MTTTIASSNASRSLGRRTRFGTLSVSALALVAGLVTGLGALEARAQQGPASKPDTTASASDQSTLSRIWTTARSGDQEALINAFKAIPASAPEVKDSADRLLKNIAKRDQARDDKIKELSDKLNTQIAKEGTDALSEAVKLAVELVEIAPDRAAFKNEERVRSLVTKAAEAAREAERNSDWFTANELFFRLDALMEEEGTFKADKRRLTTRLGMIRLYAPEQFWSLRNKDRRAAGKPDLPPYNGLGENYQEKVAGIDKTMVLKAVDAASRQQIDRVPMRDVLLGGVEAVRTMITTNDLRHVFAGLDDPNATQSFMTLLDQWTQRLNSPDSVATRSTLIDLVDGLMQSNRENVKIPDGALLHEFGIGAMSKLDEYSAIIWPDELARFNRMTQGNFVGVGVQIQLDEETQLIKVVTPLEGTPAQRAGILAGDLIKRIDGKSAEGITINQAVDQITGAEDTKVNVTIERKTGEKDQEGKDQSREIDFQLTRAIIPVSSVKGWKKSGVREDDWDYFIDPTSRIGYVRLLQFTEETTSDLHKAINQMQQGGQKLGGLILDLRYNPGGLLTEAVGVANTFVERGTIVSTEGTIQGEVKPAKPEFQLLKSVPVAVLINQGSASASEIVSGALRFYGDKGDIPAIVIGQRSFGKGSVQNVWPLAANAKMKLTTQYYKLPDNRIIHRKPGSVTWGVDPNLKIDELPDTQSEALKLRQDADVVPIDAQGHALNDGKPRPDPRKLLDDGLDVQLQTALVILQARAASGTDKPQARANQ